MSLTWEGLIQLMEKNDRIYRREQTHRMVAFLTGHHPRCGALSPLMATADRTGLSPDILRLIAEKGGEEEIWCNESYNGYPWGRKVRCTRTRTRISSLLAFRVFAGSEMDFIYFHISNEYCAFIRVPGSRRVSPTIWIWWAEKVGSDKYRYFLEAGARFETIILLHLHRNSFTATPPSPHDFDSDSDDRMHTNALDKWLYRTSSDDTTLDTVRSDLSDWSRYCRYDSYRWGVGEFPGVRLPLTPIGFLLDRALSAYETEKRRE